MRIPTEPGFARHFAVAAALVLLGACSGGGGGTTDSGPTPDSGTDSGVDAGGQPDSGIFDSGHSDSGTVDSGTVDAGDAGCNTIDCLCPQGLGSSQQFEGCMSDCDCASGICLSGSEPGEPKTCSIPCMAAAACPNSTWTCASDGIHPAVPGSDGVCICIVTGSGQETCNGIDDDCNGLVDQGNLCPGMQVCTEGSCECPNSMALCDSLCTDLNTDIFNCGSCGTECPDTESSDYACVAAAADGGTPSCECEGTMCPGSIDGGMICSDTDKDPNNCGGCAGASGGVACCEGDRCYSGTCQPADREWARWPVLDPKTYGIGTTGATSYIIDNVTLFNWEYKFDQNDVRTQADAEKYCTTLAGSTGLAFTLPSRIELLSIATYATTDGGMLEDSTTGLFIPDIFGLNSNTTLFWTESAAPVDSSGNSRGWALDFSSGTEIAEEVTTTAFVRCVVLPPCGP